MYQYAVHLDGVDWEALKANLITDDQKNRCTAVQPRNSFLKSQCVVMVWVDDPVDFYRRFVLAPQLEDMALMSGTYVQN